MSTVEEIRECAISMALADGYTQLNPDAPTDLLAVSGKFEGEPYYAPYFYTTAMNGEGDEPLTDGERVAADVLEVTEDEHQAFELNQDTAFMALWYSESGFVTLQELTADEYDDLRAQYDESNDDEG